MINHRTHSMNLILIISKSEIPSQILMNIKFPMVRIRTIIWSRKLKIINLNLNRYHVLICNQVRCFIYLNLPKITNLIVISKPLRHIELAAMNKIFRWITQFNLKNQTFIMTLRLITSRIIVLDLLQKL